MSVFISDIRVVYSHSCGLTLSVFLLLRLLSVDLKIKSSEYIYIYIYTLISVSTSTATPSGMHSKAWVYGCLFAGTAVTNPVGMSISRSCYLLSNTGLCDGRHSPRGVLPSVVCLSVIEKSYKGSLDPLGLLSHEKNEGFNFVLLK